MDLLEDFDRARTTLTELGAIGERFEPLASSDDADTLTFGGAGLDPGAVGGGGGGAAGGYADLPTLTLETTARQAARCGAALLFPWGPFSRCAVAPSAAAPALESNPPPARRLRANPARRAPSRRSRRQRRPGLLKTARAAHPVIRPALKNQRPGPRARPGPKPFP
jgi:hypothetical protein